MEGIFTFNTHLLTIVVGIIVVVGWMMIATLTTHLEIDSSSVNPFYHSNIIESVWTTVPGLVLLSLVSPSFSLLYGFDEVSHSKVFLRIFGHQWYWRYELTDRSDCTRYIDSRFGTYVLGDEWLKMEISGLKRTLEVNQRVILPINKEIKLEITGVDVLHSWAIPSFGIKVDACPGRTSNSSLFIKRIGLFFGQCSEICGVNHGFMPIVIFTAKSEDYYNYATKHVFNITHV